MTQAVGWFLVGYPLAMALLWSLLALAFAWCHEWRDTLRPEPGERGPCPPVSVVIPCFNEGAQLPETLGAALRLNWPDWEVIAVDDGSCDGTGVQLDAWAHREPRLRVVHLASNQGKALALRAGALLARHEWLVCIDGDALLHPDAVAWLVGRLQSDPRLGAVTGNPRIRNRTTVLGRIQVGEFAMIVGLIKRAQAMLGGLFCVSGVVGAFRRSALHQVGYWDPRCLTEDIAITWSLQRAGWRVAYEPRALVWILMPETLRGLWRQRRRWAEGGVQVLLANLDLLLRPSQWRLLPLLLEPLLSLIWAWTLALATLVALGTISSPASLLGAVALPHAMAVALPLVAALQFAVSVWLDRPYDRGLLRNGFWMIWYPLAYWLILLFAALVAVPRALLRGGGGRARWVSPDRGIVG